MVAERGKAEACQKEELCCSRHWMNTLLGNLKREEAGQHEMPVRPILLPPCFSDSPGLKEAKGSESAGTKGRKTCVLVLSVHAFKLWIPVFLQRKEEAQSHLFFFFRILADEQTARFIRICWHPIINYCTFCQRFSRFPILLYPEGMKCRLLLFLLSGL